MKQLSFRLPFPPSVNRIWRALGGRVVLSGPARAWKIKAANALPAGRVVPLRGRLAVLLTLHAPAKLENKPWDVFNREKLLCDLLTEQRVWLDDSQIDDGRVKRGAVDSGAGYVDVLIEEI
jgi:crossover junction endodeoxyribonuclease RusA